MKHEVKFEGTKAIVSVSFELDPNGDGQPVLKSSHNVELDLAEVPDEVMSLVVKKKAEKK